MPQSPPSPPDVSELSFAIDQYAETFTRIQALRSTTVASRELSTAITHAETAQLWLEKAERLAREPT